MGELARAAPPSLSSTSRLTSPCPSSFPRSSTSTSAACSRQSSAPGSWPRRRAGRTSLASGTAPPTPRSRTAAGADPCSSPGRSAFSSVCPCCPIIRRPARQVADRLQAPVGDGGPDVGRPARRSSSPRCFPRRHPSSSTPRRLGSQFASSSSSAGHHTPRYAVRESPVGPDVEERAWRDQMRGDSIGGKKLEGRRARRVGRGGSGRDGSGGGTDRAAGGRRRDRSGSFCTARGGSREAGSKARRDGDGVWWRRGGWGKRAKSGGDKGANEERNRKGMREARLSSSERRGRERASRSGSARP